MQVRSRAAVFGLAALGLAAGAAALAQPASAPPERPSTERPATAEARIALGHDIVRRDCAGCHAVGLTGKSPQDDAPPFRELHQRFDVEMLSESLAEGIVVGHGAMPTWIYDPVEIEALIAYLKSLEPPPG